MQFSKAFADICLIDLPAMLVGRVISPEIHGFPLVMVSVPSFSSRYSNAEISVGLMVIAEIRTGSTFLSYTGVLVVVSSTLTNKSSYADGASYSYIYRYPSMLVRY